MTIIRSNNIDKVSNPRLCDENTFQSINSKQKGTGSICITGQPGGQVLVSVPDTIKLSNHKGGHILYQPDKPFFNVIPDQISSKYFNYKTGGQAELNTKKGKLYIWYGGKPAKMKVHKGNYEGNCTIRVVYN